MDASQSPLDWYEYLGIVFVLIASVVLISWRRSSDSALTEKLSLMPVAISLIASSTSGMTMLAKPTESYKHGIQFFVVSTTFFFINLCISSVFFMPVLFKLKADSIYQYFEERFGRSVRMLTSATFIMAKVFGSAVVALPPSVVISHFSGLPINVVTSILLIITTFYTTVGGYVGVIWTDALQGIVMFVTMTILCVISVVRVGGPAEVLRISQESGRLNLPETPFDPTARVPFWIYLCCLSGLSIIFFNQSMYQRYKSLENKKDLSLSLCFQFLGTTFFTFSATIVGLSVYAYYYGCDPKTAKYVNSYTDVIVYWLDDVGQEVKGFRGVYIAGITCASISTLSTHFNSCAGLITREWLPKTLTNTPTKFSISVKWSTTIVGLFVLLLAVSVEGTGSLLELSYYFSGVDAVVSGFFILGIFVVPANTKGTLISGFACIILNFIILGGSKFYASRGLIPSFPVSYMSTDKCPANSTSILEPAAPLSTSQSPPVDSVFYLFRVSPFAIAPLITISNVILGFLLSLAFRDEKAYERDPDLYSPYALKLWPRYRYLKGSTHELSRSSKKLFIP